MGGDAVALGIERRHDHRGIARPGVALSAKDPNTGRTGSVGCPPALWLPTWTTLQRIDGVPGTGQVRRLLIPIGLLVFVVVVAVVVSRSSAAPQTVRPAHNNPTLVALATTPHIAAQCPWLARAMERDESPAELARLVTGA